jgi:hypothetical protein
MIRRGFFIYIVLLLFSISSYAQKERRSIYASRIFKEPKIDAKEDPAIWKDIEAYGDFSQYEPYNGGPPTQQSLVKIAYTDNAVYFYASFFDSHADSIVRGLCKRDAVSNSHADVFKVSIDPFNDGIYAYEFSVSASGVQEDRRISPSGNSLNWDAVWLSAVDHTKDGWFIEVKIPFSALRFPNKDVQEWGVNVWRNIRRNREWSSLNFVDKEQQGSITQSAVMKGIQGVKPPLRLALYPYVSSYVQQSAEQENLSYSFNYGADLKYGINESFTLDLTLIPDFGQVESDDEVLNLSPFEVRYNEKRQFFTEGTELFNKGGVFYSRRIGGTPEHYAGVEDSLREGEEIISNPDKTNLINAVKISGRNKKGLGVGFFNAMTSAAHATIVDSNGVERKIETQAFSNFSILVFDQTLKNNSYISLINTNVSRKGYAANVLGSVFTFRNKPKTYAFSGSFIVSQQFKERKSDNTGYKYGLTVSKTAGNFQFSLSQSVESDTYDPNDLGYLQVNNSFNHALSLHYNIYEPFWRVHFWNNSFWVDYNRLYNPNLFNSFSLNASTRTRFQNHLSCGFEVNASPIASFDFYEARIEGMKFREPPYIRLNTWISPDYRKVLAVDVNLAYRYSWEFQANALHLKLAPRIRFSDKFLLVLSSTYYMLMNDRAYATTISDFSGQDISVFGRRDNQTITNSISADYIFSNKSFLSFRLRHYWSLANYYEYYALQSDGTLVFNDYNENHDINYNAFTIDMSYVWQFAPGSEMSVVWKNAIFTSSNEIIYSYVDDLRETFASPGTNSISIKLLYYLDYQYFSRKKII